MYTIKVETKARAKFQRRVRHFFLEKEEVNRTGDGRDKALGGSASPRGGGGGSKMMLGM